MRVADYECGRIWKRANVTIFEGCDFRLSICTFVKVTDFLSGTLTIGTPNNRALIEVPRFHIGSLMPKHAKRQVDSQKGWRAPSEMGLMCQKPLLSKKNPKISEHGVWQNRLLAKEPFDTRHQSPSEISFALWYEAFFALPDFLCAARAFHEGH